MDRLKAKQIENALDTDSNQDVNGTKNFTAPQIFSASPQNVVITGGYIYWCAQGQVLDEPGNSRLSLLGGVIQAESFDGISWNPNG